jgi:hypothetical protein
MITTMRPLLCILRLGHRWETNSDVEGSITRCKRCGKLRHAGTTDLRAAVDDASGDPIRSHAESVIIQNAQHLDDLP